MHDLYPQVKVKRREFDELYVTARLADWSTTYIYLHKGTAPRLANHFSFFR